MNFIRPGALYSVAYKEFLHIARDWRILVLLATFPPMFTLMMGHAFEASDSEFPVILRDRDQSSESIQFAGEIAENKTFALKKDAASDSSDLLHAGVRAIIVIPSGWGAGLNNGDPIPIEASLDGSDTTTAPQIEGALKEALGKYQLESRDVMVDHLPDGVIELGKQIPEDFRNKIVSSMSEWTVKTEIAYNPELKFTNYVAPGIIGLVLQLLTVPLLAVTITRERETGTLSQLLLTSLRHSEIVIGKVIPYLGLSTVMIAVVIAITHWHFHVNFMHLGMLSFLCFLFLLCSLGLGLVISSFCDTQAQAIQFTVFFLLPIIPLSGAFAPLEQMPEGIRSIAEIFPLTHFCRVFRLVNLSGASFEFLRNDIIYLGLGSIVTFAAAALLLRRTQN